MPKNKSFSLTIPRDLYEQVLAASIQQHRSPNGQVCHILEAALEKAAEDVDFFKIIYGYHPK